MSAFWNVFAWSLLTFNLVICDVYFQNPRGSNNRLNGSGRNRKNANRMFDSQNNARGGYNVGSLYYYVGSKLQIEWTNQHSCGDQNNHCDIVLQYMCGEQVRDGTTTATIPNNPALCANSDCNTDQEYGMHEDFYSYAHCRLRSRNLGLFTANQGLRRPSAAHTRQNRIAKRYGYECPEEKDYFPYWGPTGWRDIAVLTTDLLKCPTIKSESQNVKEKFACKVGKIFLYQNVLSNPTKYIPITQKECEEYTYTENGVTTNGTWQSYAAHGIPAPECLDAPPSRDNHHGNTLGGQTLNFNWTVPNVLSENCALRIRYNISTTDYDGQTTNASFNNLGNRNKRPGVKIWEKYGLTKEEGIRRGYLLVNDPVVNVFNSTKLPLRLAIDTAQFGRTFQDRSFTFAIRARPADIPSNVEILNINVRGKRGNIVQVYPAVEYDFTPNTALVKTDSYVHYQWTGSNNNPRNNNGQGAQGTDRSNLIMLREPTYVEEDPTTYKNNTFGQYGASYPARIPDSVLGGLSQKDLISLAVLGQQFRGDMTQLNDAGTYYDLGARKVTSAGTYHYMCTRNNQFTNRSQKGKLVVTNSNFNNQNVGTNGGVLQTSDANGLLLTSVHIPPQALKSSRMLELWELSSEDTSHVPPPPNKNYISRMIYLGPSEKMVEKNKSLTVEIRLKEVVSALHVVYVYRLSSEGSSWEKMKMTMRNSDTVIVDTTKGGYFVATKQIASASLAALVIGLLVAFIIITTLVVYAYKKRLILSGFREKI